MDLKRDQKDLLTGFLNSQERDQVLTARLLELGFIKSKARLIMDVLVPVFHQSAGGGTAHDQSPWLEAILQSRFDFFRDLRGWLERDLVALIEARHQGATAAPSPPGPMQAEWVLRINQEMEPLGLSLEDMQADVSLQLPTHHLQKDDPPHLFLAPTNRFIGLVGRDSEMEFLQDWCGEGKTLSCQVIKGDGGMGKTRLALEFALRLRDGGGWDAGFLYREQMETLVRHPRFPQWRPVVDTLMIIDYAAWEQDLLTRLFSRLKDWVENRREGAQPTVRLLLLERNASFQETWRPQWISAFQGANNMFRQLGMEHQVYPLKSLDGGQPEANQTVVDSVFKSWAALDEARSAPELPGPGDLNWDRLMENTQRRPLYLQLAALHACETGQPRDMMLWDQGTLLKTAVEREETYLAQICPQTGFQEMVQRAGALMVFTGPLAPGDPEWTGFLQEEIQDCGFSGQSPGRIGDFLTQWLTAKPGTDGELLPLHPDLTAAAFAVTVLGRRPHQQAASLHRVLDWKGQEGWERLLLAGRDLYGVPGYCWMDRLEALLEKRPKLELVDLASRLSQPSAALQLFKLVLAKKLLERAETLDERANRWSHLGDYLAALGRREEALEAALRAKEIHEDLTRQNPDAFAPNLARSLGNLGNIYSKLSLWDEALTVTKRAVMIREQLTERNPDAYRPDLARSLNNLGSGYTDLGRLEDAVAASKRAQEIFEDLAGSNPDAFLPDLARSLNNLGTRYFAMRRHGQALTAAQRANEIYEDLARSNPDAYLPDLAQSFMTLGFVHQEVRHWGEAQRCFYQGIVKLKEPFLQYPSAFSGFMDGLIGDYAAFCETIEKTPDMELIGPLLKKLEQLKLLEAPEEE